MLLIDEQFEENATKLRRSGLLKLPDAIVAATAVVNDFRLITLDKKLALAIENFK